jgi:hypothetical protein
MQARTTRTVIWWLVLAMAGCAMATGAGCNILGPIMMVASGPPTAPAAFTIPEGKSAVIIIDDPANRVPQRSLREVIGRTAEQDMLERKAAKDMIQSGQALAVLARERFGQKQTIDALGRSLKADIVIYATVDVFTLTDDGQTFAPRSAMRVKVVDSATGDRLYPPESVTEWHPIAVRLPPQAIESPVGQSGATGMQMQAFQDLAGLTGVALGRMFYKHEIGNDPNQLRERR